MTINSDKKQPGFDDYAVYLGDKFNSLLDEENNIYDVLYKEEIEELVRIRKLNSREL